jgi:hypothetical protein
MKELLSQVKIAIDNNLYYLALNTTLSLPDICSALSSPTGETTGKQYVDWYNKHALGKCSSKLDGYACYKFRCSTLHQGHTQDKNLGFSRVLFIEPSPSNNLVLHDNILNDALNIDLRIFCYGMIKAVLDWLNEIQDTQLFKANYEKFMKRYPNGLEPYIVGISAIS